MYILIAIAVGAVIMFVGGVVGGERGKELSSGATWSLWAVVPLVVFMVVGGVIFLANASTGNKLVAYHEANQAVYADAVDEIRTGIPDSASGFFDAANLKQIEAFGGAVTDGRDEMVWFNRHLQTRRFWEKNPFLGIFIPDLDPSIQPVRE